MSWSDWGSIGPEFARLTGENWDERRALNETLYWRAVQRKLADQYIEQLEVPRGLVFGIADPEQYIQHFGAFPVRDIRGGGVERA